MLSYFKFGPVVKEMSLKEKVYRQGKTDVRRMKTDLIPHLEPSAQVS